MSSVSGNGAVAIANDCSSNCLLFLCRSPPTDLEIVTFTTFQNIGGMIMLYDTKLCGKRIQLLRKQKKLTQLQLAMRVNSTDKHIGGIGKEYDLHPLIFLWRLRRSFMFHLII